MHNDGSTADGERRLIDFALRPNCNVIYAFFIVLRQRSLVFKRLPVDFYTAMHRNLGDWFGLYRAGGGSNKRRCQSYRGHKHTAGERQSDACPRGNSRRLLKVVLGPVCISFIIERREIRRCLVLLLAVIRWWQTFPCQCDLGKFVGSAHCPFDLYFLADLCLWGNRLDLAVPGHRVSAGDDLVVVAADVERESEIRRKTSKQSVAIILMAGQFFEDIVHE